MLLLNFKFFAYLYAAAWLAGPLDGLYYRYKLRAKKPCVHVSEEALKFSSYIRRIEPYLDGFGTVAWQQDDLMRRSINLSESLIGAS